MNRHHSLATSAAVVRAIRPLVAFGIVASLSVLPITIAASSVPAPVLTIDPVSYVVSPAGQVTITGTTTNSTTCKVKGASFQGTPHVPVLPVSIRCDAGAKPKRFSVPIAMPPNSGLAGAHDTLSFSAVGRGGTKTKNVKVDVEAYAWSLAQRPTGSSAQLNSASCATVSDCVAGGTKGLLIHFSVTGVTETNADGTNTVTSVSCLPGSPIFCAAVDDVGHVLTFDGTKWSTVAVVGGPSGSAPPLTVVGSWSSGPPLSTVSCKVRGSSQSDTLCVVADETGDVTTIDFVSGQPPSVSKSIATGLKGQAFAACTTASSCVVADLDGDGVFYDGKSWTTPSAIDPSGEVTGLSCSSDGACVLVDASGGATSFTAQQCGANAPCLRVRESPSGQHPIRSVSCVSGLCVIVAADGSVYQQTFAAGSLVRKGWDGTVKGLISESESPAAVACSRDSSSPLVLGCSIFTSGSSNTPAKQYIGHVTIVK